MRAETEEEFDEEYSRRVEERSNELVAKFREVAFEFTGLNGPEHERKVVNSEVLNVMIAASLKLVSASVAAGTSPEEVNLGEMPGELTVGIVNLVYDMMFEAVMKARAAAEMAASVMGDVSEGGDPIDSLLQKMMNRGQ